MRFVELLVGTEDDPLSVTHPSTARVSLYSQLFKHDLLFSFRSSMGACLPPTVFVVTWTYTYNGMLIPGPLIIVNSGYKDAFF